MKSRHSIECQIDQANHTLAEFIYEQKWPKYCRSCFGWGGRATYDNRPTFMAPEPPGFDECMSCVANDVCPRCGEENAFCTDVGDFDNECCHCKFRLDGGTGLDEPPECPLSYGMSCVFDGQRQDEEDAEGCTCVDYDGFADCPIHV